MKKKHNKTSPVSLFAINRRKKTKSFPSVNIIKKKEKQQIFSNQIVGIVIVEEKETRRSTPLPVKNGGKISKNEKEKKTNRKRRKVFKFMIRQSACLYK